MTGHFRTFSLSSRPTGGLLLLVVLGVVILLPLVLIAAILAIVFFAVRLILQAIGSMLSVGSKSGVPGTEPLSGPFGDDEGRRNVRVRQIQGSDSPSET